MSKIHETNLIKSRKRVNDHGEVFTPVWMVDEMLNIVNEESFRIDSRFLEPACGSGNFLCSVLIRKLKTVELKYKKSIFERRNNALFSLMSIYGIELLGDNVKECRDRLLEIYSNFLSIEPSSDWYRAGEVVLKANIIQGDALTLTSNKGKDIVFPEWGYLGAGKFQRRDFKFESLTMRLAFNVESLNSSKMDQAFVPIKAYPQMSIKDIAK